jgi:hypothetical protein
VRPVTFVFQRTSVDFQAFPETLGSSTQHEPRHGQGCQGSQTARHNYVPVSNLTVNRSKRALTALSTRPYVSPIAGISGFCCGSHRAVVPRRYTASRSVRCQWPIGSPRVRSTMIAIRDARRDLLRSCPGTWCSCRRGLRAPRQGREGQRATAGKLTNGSSLNSAMVSSVMYLARWTAHSSFCSSSSAPTRRTMASSLGKMPTTSVPRLISPLRRSIGLIEWSLARCSLGKVV